MTVQSHLTEARQQFHRACVKRLLVFDTFKSDRGSNSGLSVPCASNADGGNEASRFLANHVADSLGAQNGRKLPGQTAGNEFERLVSDFLESTFLQLAEFRPGKWDISVFGSRERDAISSFDQYAHLETLQSLAKSNIELRSSLGNEYSIAPDIVVQRFKYDDVELNSSRFIVDDTSANLSSLRSKASSQNLLHASVSCKWTMRSDRAQNARSEALNLIRNRKGRVPHIVAVVGEPTPSRLASIALGTGDLDCVYHFALDELVLAVSALGQSEAMALLQIMIEGKRLKDISDLPLDLCV